MTSRLVLSALSLAGAGLSMLGLLLIAASMSDVPLFELDRGSVDGLLNGTAIGTAGKIRVVALLVAALLGFWPAACGSASKAGPCLVMLRCSKAVSKAARMVKIGVGRNLNQSAIAVSFQSLAAGTGGVPLWTPIHNHLSLHRAKPLLMTLFCSAQPHDPLSALALYKNGRRAGLVPPALIGNRRAPRSYGSGSRRTGRSGIVPRTSSKLLTIGCCACQNRDDTSKP